jgi:molecular chaperone DnaK (HSP70)
MENNKYQKGKIYKIVCDTLNLTYYGSTIEPTVAKRLTKHISVFNSYKKGKANFVTSFKLFENNNYNIFLVENYPSYSKDELHARERFYIENNECVNKNIPCRTIKEYIEANKDKLNEKFKEYRDNNKDKIKECKKEYREKNKDKIKECKKEHYQNNKDKIDEKNKEYYEKNKDRIKEYKIEWSEKNKDKIKECKKEYRENNKDKIKEKFNCECGGCYTYEHKTSHFKTNLHQEYLKL